MSARAATPRPRASRYASGVPSIAITEAEIVAVYSDVSRADPTPGAEETPPPSRTTNATIGASRYRASSPPSHGSGLRARAITPQPAPTTPRRPIGTAEARPENFGFNGVSPFFFNVSLR